MKKSFTLVEIVIVMAVLAILMSVVAPSGFRSIEKARILRALGDYNTYRAAIVSLYSDTGHWPVDVPSTECPVKLESGETALDHDKYRWHGWDGPYLEKMQPSTPWAGIYYLCYLDSSVVTIKNSLWLAIENRCYPDGASDTCGMSDRTGLRIDELLDYNNGLKERVFVGKDGDYCAQIAGDVE